MEKNKILENQEKQKDYSLSITITRHGAKEGIDGGLSRQGQEEAEQYFTEAYRGIPIDETVEREIVSSSKNRAKETALEYQLALKKASSVPIKKTVIDDRLSEKDFVKFASTLSEEEKKNILKVWLENPLGKENLRNFIEWLLEKITTQKEKGGDKEIDAFSHAPLMAIFLIEIEKRLGINIFTASHSQDNYSIKNILGYDSKIGYLTDIKIITTAKKSDKFNLLYRGQNIEIPIKILEDILKDI